MRPECERFQTLRVVDDAEPLHDPSCADCVGYVELIGELSPPDALTATTLQRVAPILRERRATRRRLVLQVALAGALSFPLLLLLNGLLLWATYALGSRVISPEAGSAVSAFVGAALLLFLSLAYGSLPIMASWGLRHRERIA